MSAAALPRSSFLPVPTERVVRSVDPRSVFFALLLALLVGTLVQPPVGGQWHAPDVHGSVPHRASSSTSPADGATLAAAALLPRIDSPGGVSTGSTFEPEQAEIDPPDHPPR